MRSRPLLLLACVAAATWLGCRGDAHRTPFDADTPNTANTPNVPSTPASANAPTPDGPAFSVRARIYGPDTTRDDNFGGDTFHQDIVVHFLGPYEAACSGVLITPTLVLTAAHCVVANGRPKVEPAVLIGPHAGGDPALPTGARRVVRLATDPIAMGTGENPNTDLALVPLADAVMDIAESRRPMSWNGWSDDIVLGSTLFGDPYARFGIAGWSDQKATWSCPDIKAGASDDEHSYWRQHAEGMTEASFTRGHDDATITWLDDNRNKATKADSGGPIYHMIPDAPPGSREVIGVASKDKCAVTPGLGYYRTVLYTDVTHGATRAWIAQHADDHRSADWLARHGNLVEHWAGEVDYLGPCKTADGAGLVDTRAAPPPDQDLDCDHWYDVHDDCPRDYDPEQQEDATGHGLACANRSQLDFDPQHPRAVTKDIDLGTCASGQPGCAPGVCYFAELTGQLWQSTADSRRYLEPDFAGSYARIAIVDGHFRLQQGIVPDRATGEWYMPPEVVWHCTHYDEIASLADPAACSYTEYALDGGPPDASGVALDAGWSSFNVLTGIVGNAGFPGPSRGRSGSLVRVDNVASDAQTFLLQTRDTSTGRRAVMATALTATCQGWTHQLALPSIAVRAAVVPTTQVLVSGPHAVTAGGKRAVACFLTGVGGPWGGWSHSMAEPSARIWSDPVTRDILLTVTPPGIAGSYEIVEAYASCLDLSRR